VQFSRLFDIESHANRRMQRRARAMHSSQLDETIEDVA